MKASTIFVLAAAAVVSAAPAPNGGGGGSPPPSGGDCNNDNSHQVCCNGLSCLVQVLGSACSGSAYCCEGDVSGGIINIGLLNCVKLL